MTRNSENIVRINMGPFRGLNQNADRQDVADGYFVDGENLVCTKKPGSVLTRPGFHHWMVDANGYGVVFPDPIAILPGGGNVDGIITQPAVVPVTPGPGNAIIPINEEPPLIPDNGPTTPVTAPQDEPVVQPPTPEPPAGGAITLVANPNHGNVANGSDLTVNFTVQENLPAGVSIATYGYDFFATGSFSADTSTSSTTVSHDYAASDFTGMGQNVFVRAIVLGTGSDTKTYSAGTTITIKVEDAEEQDRPQLRITSPKAGTTLQSDANTTFIATYYTKNTAGDYVATTTDVDAALYYVDGVGTTMKNGDGSAITETIPNAHIPLDFANTASATCYMRAVLPDDKNSGTITVAAIQNGTNIGHSAKYGVAKGRILAEIVNATGSGITSMDWSDAGNDYMYWTFYVKLTAQNESAETVTDFNNDVKLTFAFSKPDAGYSYEWDESYLSAFVMGIDQNAIYSATTADEVTTYVGNATIPGSAFSAGDSGQASAKIEIWKDIADYDYTTEATDLNSGVGIVTVRAEISE